MGVYQWAVEGDPNDHGHGELIADNPKTVFCHNIPVIEHEDPAHPDDLCPPGPHCNPKTQGHSNTVFVYNNPVHRINDTRICGAKTVKKGNADVYVGD